MEFVVDHGIKFVNLCPKHDIVILLEDGEKLVVPPSGIVARCTSSEVVVRTMGRVQGLFFVKKRGYHQATSSRLISIS